MATQKPDSRWFSRLPADMQQCLTLHPQPCSRKAAEVLTEVLTVGHCDLTIHYPRKVTHGCYVVFHLPGGLDISREERHDHVWCSNLADEIEAIVVDCSYPSTHQIENRGSKYIQTNINECLETVRKLAAGDWAARWLTRPENIVLSGSSYGFYPAFTLAMDAAEDNKIIKCLVGIVPVVDLSPALDKEPWGENHDIDRGLTPTRLLKGIAAIHGTEPDNQPKYNPATVQDRYLRQLPRTILVFAEQDILCDSGLKFADRLSRCGVDVRSTVVQGVHQVKELSRDVESGARVIAFVNKQLIALREESP